MVIVHMRNTGLHPPMYQGTFAIHPEWRKWTIEQRASYLEDVALQMRLSIEQAAGRGLSPDEAKDLKMSLLPEMMSIA